LPNKELVQPPTSLDVTGDIGRVRDAAQSLRDSFVSYFKHCGRNREGVPLLLDPERLRSAEAFERAYFAGKDYIEEALRGSLKTTQAVYAHSWMLGRNPNLTFLHYSCKNDEAFQRNLWLQAALRQDEHRTIFGERGSLSVNNCSQYKTVVRGNDRRNANPNVLACGIEAARAGPHKHRLWGDDLVDERNTVAEPAKIAVVRNAWNYTVLPMLDSRSLCEQLNIEAGGCVYYNGTPYTENDLHTDLIRAVRKNIRWIHQSALSEYGETDTAVYRRIVAGGPEEGFASPIPSLLTPDELRAEWELNERAFDLTRRLLPLGLGEKPFRRIYYWIFPSWDLKAWPALARNIGYRPAQPPDLQLNPKTRTWPTALVVDPGFTEGRESSYTGYVIVSLGDDGRVYVLHGARVRRNWDETLDMLIETAKQWNVRRVVLEAAAQQTGVLRLFKNAGLMCEGISHGNKSKWLRAMDVSADVNSGRVVFPGWVDVKATPPNIVPMPTLADYDCGDMKTLVSCLNTFPAGPIADRDMVDAVVYGIQVMRERSAPFAPRRKRPNETDEMERIRRGREQIFGHKPKPQERAEYAILRGG